jgi:hypothetical protein
MRKLQVAGLAMCLAIVASSTASAKVTRTTLEFFFPGVDVDGFLDDSLGGDGTVRVTYNDRNGRLRVRGRANVTNESGRAQVYTDTGVLDEFISDGDIIRDRYTVSARGRARYNGLVRNATDVFIEEDF